MPVGDDEVASGDVPDSQIVETLVAVVAAGQYLQHHGVVVVAAGQALGQQPHQRLCAGHHLRDPFGAIRGIGMLVEIAQ